MARPPVMPGKDKIRIVLSVPSGAMTVAEAARRTKVSEQSVGTWTKQFLEGRAGLAAGAGGRASPREEQLEAEIEQLTTALARPTCSRGWGTSPRSTVWPPRRPRGERRGAADLEVLRAHRHPAPPGRVSCGESAEGAHEPAPGAGAIEPDVARDADWPAGGHRKSCYLRAADGPAVLASPGERAMRRRGLLQPVDSQRRRLAQARRAALADPPPGANQIWRPDVSAYETPAGGTRRIAGVAGSFTGYGHGWRLGPAGTGADALTAVTLAGPRPNGSPDGLWSRPSPTRGRPDPPDQAGHRQRRGVSGGRVRGVHRLPARTGAHPHGREVSRPQRGPGTGLRLAEVRAPLPAGDRGPARVGPGGRGLPADLQPHPAA